MEAKPNKRNKRLLWTILFILLNVAVIGFTAMREFGSGSRTQTALTLGSHGGLWLMGGLGCLAVVLAAETGKYLLMMLACGEKVSLRTAFETAALGKYYDSITPSGTGGQPFQIWWLHRNGYSSGAAGAMPIVDFLTMQAGFVVPALLTFLLWRTVELEAIRYTAWIGLFCFSFVPCLLVFFSIAPKSAERFIAAVLRVGGQLRIVKGAEQKTQHILETLTRYHDSFRALAEKRGLLAALMGLSVLYRLALCSMPWFVLRALGGEAAYLPVLAMTIYITAAIAILPTPGNSGAAEGSFYLVFSAAGASGVFWAMLIWRLLCYYSFILIGAGIYAVNAMKRKKVRTLGKEVQWNEAA